MSTPIQPVPDVVLASEFPSLADRPAGTYNQKAKAFADSANPMSVRNREIAVVGHNNAVVATEQADIALQAAQDATTNGAIQVGLATVQADRAQAAALAAESAANYAGAWSSLTGPLTVPASAFHNGKFWILLSDVADVTANEPGISANWAQPSGVIDFIAYADRAELRSATASTGDSVVVENLGLFIFQEGSDEPDDDESCFATASGRWLLEAPHWNVIDSWQLPDSFDERVLFGAANCAITTVNAASSASFTGTVTGAVPGDRVIATPPSQLGSDATNTGRFSYHAWVSATDTVTVMLSNPSAANATTNAAIRTAWPITVIKRA